MKLVRPLSFALLLGIAASATAQYASPEVMLVTSYGSSPARIDRYDPISGQYLGAFGSGYLHSPIGMCVSGSEAYVTDDFSVGGTLYTKIDKFNWSTGAYDGSIYESAPYQFNSVQVYKTSLIVTDFGSAGSGAAIYTYDIASGARLGATNLPANAYPWRMTVHNNQLFLTSPYSNALVRYNLNANGTISGAATTLVSGTPFYGIASNTGTHVAGDWLYTAEFNGSANVLARRSTSGGLNDSYTGQLYNSLSFGHNSVLYGLVYGLNTVDRFDADAGLYLGPMGSFTLSQSASPQDITVFAAPEPISVAALGLGVLTLLRRRKTL